VSIIGTKKHMYFSYYHLVMVALPRPA